MNKNVNISGYDEHMPACPGLPAELKAYLLCQREELRKTFQKY